MKVKDIKKIVVETEEPNPIIIATITEDEMDVAKGYQIRLRPVANDD